MNKNKVIKLVFLSLSILSIFPTLTLPAHAGIAKKLVEVDEAERERLEQERIAMQEAYEEEAKKLAEERRKLEELRNQEEARKAAIENASRLREQEITQLGKEFAQTPAPEKVLDNKAHAHDASCSCRFFCIICKIVTLPITLVGMVLPHTDKYECHLCSRLFN